MPDKRSLRSWLPNKRAIRSQKPGTAPGTVDYMGIQKVDEVYIHLLDYDATHVDKLSVTEIEECRPYLEEPTKTWINVTGLHDVEKLKRIWSYFDLHPLIQEDIVNTGQRPKVESYENCIFFVLRMFSYSVEEKALQSEQISIVLGPNYVLSFQETDNNYFKPILDRLENKAGRIRNHPTDYMAYALIDTIVDHYFTVIQQVGDEIERMEDLLFEDKEEEDNGILQQIHNIRREIVYFRKSTWPLRDALNTAIRDESDLISDNTKLFLRDVHDHMIQVIDSVENYRDLVLSLHDLYMSNISNRMNEIMKVLTIIATIFIPLTFVAGIYGMNFNPEASPYNMPELSYYWGYPVAWAVMLVSAGSMVYYFKRKGWL
ncbi:magnesium/cobalt transporter CorA [Fodinibius salsisoli]|uniref:Magnesium transport protein CorA n=1 Tax=Fodinibius salsisoli TaxID=2820877 RepID=A0ABT3PRA4_9BACT|nr:magnesium/cobalt transporter CorA [Fodinibius salsisoli]MCW9708360.1 magnesium/cobalt transporter CorA [Fodinibius salsisoli]